MDDLRPAGTKLPCFSRPAIRPGHGAGDPRSGRRSPWRSPWSWSWASSAGDPPWSWSWRSSIRPAIPLAIPLVLELGLERRRSVLVMELAILDPAGDPADTTNHPASPSRLPFQKPYQFGAVLPFPHLDSP